MFNAKEFLQALEALAQEKGISKDAIIESLKEAMEKAYRKQLGTGDDALVSVDIDADAGRISMYQILKVVEEVDDDFLQISIDDIKKMNLDLQVGDDYKIEASTEDMAKAAAMTVKNIFRQKLAEAEKAALYEIYKDKMGEMIIGQVEKIDERSAIVNIGRTSVYLPKSHCIPGEVFKIGDRIKLYVIDVSIVQGKSAQINVSRADAGFLRRLFEEEIHEIYEGTVVIKNIAREAGERSKVAVYSLDPNVDPAGACIGPNGTRIQKIVGQLGNAKEKEKIDIIAYNDIPGIFIMEALKPAQVLGVVLEAKKKAAIAVIANGQSALAIGKRGVNARLAVKLTGWDIAIKEQDEALALGLHYLTADELRRDEEIRRYEEEIKRREAARQAAIDAIPPTPKDDITMTQVMAEATPSEKVTPEVAKPVAQPKPVEAPKPEKKTVIRTTKTLEDLERELEREKERNLAKATAPKKRPYKRGEKRDEMPVEKPVVTPTLTPTSYMDIYSDEEIEELEKEEVVTEEEDIDFEEFEDYYDTEE
ncbi:MAG TPA: hypothetical protein DCX17_04080 [Firmicutes bacterium]|jgi:N utilization substance protein A|nr:hypothetical protein [Bacillota bacterium]